MLWSMKGIAPEIVQDARVTPDAQVRGQVVLEDSSSARFGSEGRCDNKEIRIGKGSNVEDLCVLHTDPGRPHKLSRDCTIIHRPILHECTISNAALVGMGTTIHNRALISLGALINASALVLGEKLT